MVVVVVDDVESLLLLLLLLRSSFRTATGKRVARIARIIEIEARTTMLNFFGCSDILVDDTEEDINNSDFNFIVCC